MRCEMGTREGEAVVWFRGGPRLAMLLSLDVLRVGHEAKLSFL